LLRGALGCESALLRRQSSPERVKPLHRPLLPAGGQRADGQDLLFWRQTQEHERKRISVGAKPFCEALLLTLCC